MSVPLPEGGGTQLISHPQEQQLAEAGEASHSEKVPPAPWILARAWGVWRLLGAVEPLSTGD